MTYKEYREKSQKEFNEVPVFWAFSQKQFEEQLEKRGIKVEDAGEHIYRLPGMAGGFYLKKDADVVRAYFEKDSAKELQELMEADEKFCLEAFEYEMWNHEYPINWEGDYDVISCFGAIEFAEEKSAYDYLKEAGFSDKVIGIFATARSKVQSSFDW